MDAQASQEHCYLSREKGGHHRNSHHANLHALHHSLCAEHCPQGLAQPHRQHQAHTDPDPVITPRQALESRREQPMGMGRQKDLEVLLAPTSSSIPPPQDRVSVTEGRARGRKHLCFHGFGTEHKAPAGWALTEQEEFRYQRCGHSHQGIAQTNTKEIAPEGRRRSEIHSH